MPTPQTPIHPGAGRQSAWSLALCVLFFALWGGQSCSSPVAQEQPPDAGSPEHTPKKIRVISVNVGNSDLSGCGDYGIKLCREPVLQALKASIERLKPHLIAMQEMLSPTQCADKKEEDPEKICHHVNKDKLHPLRRLLGDAYTVSCEPRKQYECIAVRSAFGEIKGCDKGTLCTNAQSVAPPARCNQAFSASALDITLLGNPLRVVNVHPDSKDASCRQEHLAQIFEKEPKLAQGKQILVMGDLNLDPFIGDPTTDPSVALWQKYVGPGKTFAYHSGPAEHDPPYPTDLLKRTIDHVISNFAKGTCQTLGGAPNTERIDGTPETPLSRLDHLSLLCELTLPFP